MKISTLLLSSAAVLVAGAAFAADLPAKKAAPAAAPTGCAAFGAGYIAIPGGDTCLKITGGVFMDLSATSSSTRTSAPITLGGSEFDLGVLAKNQTEAGAVTSDAQINAATGGVSLDHATVGVGGFAAGYGSSITRGLNGGVSEHGGMDNGLTVNALTYAMPIGSSTLTVGVQSTQDNNNGGGVAQYPDLVGKFGMSAGSLGFSTAAAVHNVHGATSGDTTGYASVNKLTLDVSKDTQVGASLSYASGALKYLSSYGVQTSSGAYDADTNSANLGTGYMVGAQLKQAVGAGSFQITGYMGDIQGSAAPVHSKLQQIDVFYSYTGIKGMRIEPEFMFNNIDKATGTFTQSSTGYIRIARDF